MNHITIAFGNKEFKLKPSARGVILIEEMFGCSIADIPENTYGSQLKVFYCMLKACNQESFKYTFDTFLDLIDEHDESFSKFQGYMVELNQANASTEKKKTAKQSAKR